jgi:hypothetical protein
MARAVTTRRKIATTALAWAIGLLIFFPIFWTILTSFKTEAQAINNPPLFWGFDFTLENYTVVQERSNYMRFLWNSVIIAGGSTLLGILIAVPAAWSMAFVPSRRTKDILLVDALDQDAAGGGGALSDLADLRAVRSAGHADRPDRGPDADQPADHRLDALHLFPRNPRRDPGGRADGRGGAEGRNPLSS